MLAKVKDVKAGTVVTDEGHEDEFVSEMHAKIGCTLIVIKKWLLHNGVFENWYTDGDGYNYHESWLEFIGQ